MSKSFQEVTTELRTLAYEMVDEKISRVNCEKVLLQTIEGNEGYREALIAPVLIYGARIDADLLFKAIVKHIIDEQIDKISLS